MGEAKFAMAIHSDRSLVQVSLDISAVDWRNISDAAFYGKSQPVYFNMDLDLIGRSRGGCEVWD
jgi:hypothetical protein